MLVLGERSDHEQLLLEDAELNRVPVSTFALADSPAQSDIADVTCAPTNMEHTAFDYFVDGERLGSLTLAMEGDFNYANAAAALAIAHDIGMDVSDPRALASLADVRISGRMEEMHDSRSNTLAIVDYAHNFASVNALLDFVEQRYGAEHPHITLITGSAGNKAYDRREGIVKAAHNRVQKLILTAEDTDTEPIEQICSEMANNVTNEDLDVQTILDRAEAVKHAVDEARAADGGLSILLLIGKGDEQWITTATSTRHTRATRRSSDVCSLDSHATRLQWEQTPWKGTHDHHRTRHSGHHGGGSEQAQH